MREYITFDKTNQKIGLTELLLFKIMMKLNLNPQIQYLCVYDRIIHRSYFCDNFYTFI